MSARTSASTWRGMLAAKPVQNSAAAVTLAEDGTATIKVARKLPRYLVPPLSWIFVLKPHKTVALDRLGSQVWRLCDGSRTVEGVVDEIAGKYELTFHEARAAVSEYLKALIARGILAVALPETGSA